MKNKILAVLSVIGIGALLTGCSANVKADNFRENIREFTEHVSAYNKINTEKATKTIFNKYTLAISAENDIENLDAQSKSTINPNSAQNLNGQEDFNKSEKKQNDNFILDDENKAENKNTQEKDTQNVQKGDVIDSGKPENVQNNLVIDPSETSENRDIVKNKVNTMDLKEELTQDKVSTLYSLSSDIANECDDFTTLKSNLTNAIVETQNLIDKVNKKEISLTAEQRMFITEQSRQLKNLGRQLSHVTSELNLNLTDLSTMMREKGDIDSLSLKYLVVLDNLINGNEMLENGLHSLNMINSLINMNRPMPIDGQGRIVYGYQRNGEPPIIKDYIINKDGEVKENVDEKEKINETDKSTTVDESKKFSSNIDTYRGNGSNIDTFFNTALLDNEFMYGNNRYGYGGINGMYGGGYNPYVQNQYVDNNEVNANSTNSVDNTNNSQDIETNKNNEDKLKTKKKKGLKKNIDTYKNENTPTLAARFNNLKESISGFFNKFKPNDKIQNPIVEMDNE